MEEIGMSVTKLIYEKLKNKFKDNKYILENSYVFDWESDFFYMTSSGYFVEIEVKVSRSDFLADFKKYRKHKILFLTNSNQKTILNRTFDKYQITYEEAITKVVDGKRVWCDKTNKWERIPSGKPITRIIETSSDIEKYLKTYFNTSYKLLSCGIEIKKVPHSPNKFYYICPEGLIKKEEVPDYAGLYWISQNGRITEIKKAPFVHKEKLNLDKVLLNKFYYKSLNLEHKLKLVI